MFLRCPLCLLGATDPLSGGAGFYSNIFVCSWTYCCVKEQNVWFDVNLQYPMYHCTNPMFPLVDNSYSPSLVEQSQQGCGSSCYTLLAVIPSSVKCLMPYACQLASCSMGISCCASCLSFLCPYIPCVLLFCNSYPGALQPLFYPECFLIELWDNLSGFSGPPIGQVLPGVSCLVL